MWSRGWGSFQLQKHEITCSNCTVTSYTDPDPQVPGDMRLSLSQLYVHDTGSWPDSQSGTMTKLWLRIETDLTQSITISKCVTHWVFLKTETIKMLPFKQKLSFKNIFNSINTNENTPLFFINHKKS